MESETKIVRTILRENEILLRRHLVLSRSVLDQMIDKGLIADVTRRKVLMQPPHKQVPVLMNSIEYRGFQSLRKFMDVLRNTGHSWIVDILLDTDVTVGNRQHKLKDERCYRERPQPAYPRHSAQYSSTYNNACRRHRHEAIRPDNRKSYTYGLTQYNGQRENGVSLASLLKAREHVDNPGDAPRGMISTRTLFTDPLASAGTGHQLQPVGTMMPFMPGMQPYGRQRAPYPNSIDEIPMTLYGLNQAFSDQDQRNQQAMSVLRQEQIAIQQLMQQNARDQGNIRRRQAAVMDISNRLRDIHNRAKEVYEPSPHPNIGRYRLAQLNQIPWSIDN